MAAGDGGLFWLFWCVLSALHPDLSACVVPHHRFRVVRLSSLPRLSAWCGSTDDDRMMAWAWRKGATTRMGVRGWNDTRPYIEHKYESL